MSVFFKKSCLEREEQGEKAKFINRVNNPLCSTHHLIYHLLIQIVSLTQCNSSSTMQQNTSQKRPKFTNVVYTQNKKFEASVNLFIIYHLCRSANTFQPQTVRKKERNILSTFKQILPRENIFNTAYSCFSIKRLNFALK